MAGGGHDGGAGDYGGGVTFSVVVTCLMAASCGLIFGYDSGVSGAYSTVCGLQQSSDRTVTSSSVSSSIRMQQN
jgi:hypothetical protein